MARLKLKVGDNELAEHQVHHFECAYQVNEIPYLTIAIRDGDSAKESFELADTDDFSPGKTVTLDAGIDDTKNLIFSGLVIQTQVVINKGSTQLILVAKGEAVKLLEQPVNFISDKEIEDQALINAVAALSSDEEKKDAGYKFKDISSLGSNKITHPQFAAYQQTPWQSIFARMIENGAVFCPTPEGDSLINLATLAPEAVAEPFALHEVIDCQMQLDAQSRVETISSHFLDLSKPIAAKDNVNAVSNANLKAWVKPDSLYSHKNLSLSMAAPLSQEQIQARANAEANFRLLDQSQGWLTLSSVQSMKKVADLKLMSSLKVKGVGTKFAEKNLVTGIRHRFTASNWFIDVELGLPLTKTLYSDHASEPKMPATMGKVADFNKESTLPHTLSVIIPALDPAVALNARLVTPFAGKEEGFFFPPDKDAEVMVMFLDGNPSYPMIMGACHNGTNTPPLPYGEKHPKRGLFVGAGEEQMSLISEEKYESEDKKTSVGLTLMAGKKTPNSLALSAEALVLTSKDKQTLTIAKGVVLGEKAVLEATDTLKIKAGGNITIEAPLTEVK